MNTYLTIEEKRAWLARIFRDTSGEYTDADKLKALEADNRLVMLQSPTTQVNLDNCSGKDGNACVYDRNKQCEKYPCL